MNIEIPAVVVGGCSHSLAIIRSLCQEGVETHILESNPYLPGLQSRYGRVHIVDDVNGAGLAPSLIALRQKISPNERPVLYLSNDRMVRVVAAHLDEITPHYRIGWASSGKVVASLLDKSSIESQCKTAKLNYPKSSSIFQLEDIDKIAGGYEWPCIVKPFNPLSGFKVQVINSAIELHDFLSKHIEDLPVLLQEWIVGGDECIFFSAAYFDQGERQATFSGRKLRSFPMGHTTVAEPYRDEEVEQCMASFFQGTNISGMASLELKRDSNECLWVIEPTVGRTDFWLDLCIQNGINFPVINYRHLTGQAIPKPTQMERVIWINSERDILGLFWLMAHFSLIKTRSRALRFSYFEIQDPWPFWYALRSFLKALWLRGCRFLLKCFTRFYAPL